MFASTFTSLQTFAKELHLLVQEFTLTFTRSILTLKFKSPKKVSIFQLRSLQILGYFPNKKAKVRNLIGDLTAVFLKTEIIDFNFWYYLILKNVGKMQRFFYLKWPCLLSSWIQPSLLMKRGWGKFSTLSLRKCRSSYFDFLKTKYFICSDSTINF